MYTILVVDDDKMNLTTAKNLLAKDYRVITVNSGKMALTYLERNIPDLILLDIKMPEMSGYEVMQEINKIEEWKNIPVIFLTADRDNETEIQCFQLGATDFIGKPFVPAVMIGRVKRTLELERYRKDLEGAIAEQAAEIGEKNNRIMKIQHEVIWGMANLIESRDGTTGGHIKRTSTFVKLIAEQLLLEKKFSEIMNVEYVRNLIEAAPMHDIGKIAVPDYILKGEQRLSEEEYIEMQSHAAAGGKIIQETMGKVENSEYIKIAFEMATYHHERWDGTGYPERKSGEDIPLCARIMAVADVFDALAFRRSYKEAISLEKTYEIIQEASGTQFDPVVVDAFIEVRPQVEKLFEEGFFETKTK